MTGSYLISLSLSLNFHVSVFTLAVWILKTFHILYSYGFFLWHCWMTTEARWLCTSWNFACEVLFSVLPFLCSFQEETAPGWPIIYNACVTHRARGCLEEPAFPRAGNSLCSGKSSCHLPFALRKKESSEHVTSLTNSHWPSSLYFF